MDLVPEIIERLRTMLVEGATPSRLIEYIRVTHGTESQWCALVQRYFYAAFGVNSVRVPNQPEEFATCGFKFAHQNADVVHAIVQHRSEWDSSDRPPTEDKHWLDGLKATAHAQLVRDAQPTVLPELAQSWPHMDLPGQQYVQTLFGTNSLLYEQVQILSRLVEHLQHRVHFLEDQLTEQACRVE